MLFKVIHIMAVVLLFQTACRESRSDVELETSEPRDGEENDITKAIEEFNEQLEEAKVSTEDEVSGGVAKTIPPLETKAPPIQVANNPGGLGLGEMATFSQSGQCMGVFAASTANGANIRSAPCSSIDSQVFRPEYVNANDFRLIAKHSSKCVAVNAGLTTISANIHQQECLRNSDLKEVFRWQPGSGPTVRIQNAKSGLCLNIDATGNIVQDRCDLNSTLFTQAILK